jgi:acetyl-CoA carboxylase carboxyl transferase subunit alpha
MAEHEPAAMPEAWRRTELARHPERPYPMDFIEALFTDFSEIHGDRAFGDDPAMACGMARFHGRPALVVANLKGRTLKERVARKFGSPDPEGYRKALRAMKIAEKFGHPIFTFLDLAGANPGDRRGGARAGRGDCAQPAGDVAPAGADHRHGYRRGWLGRRAGAGRSRPRADAGERHLLR